MFASPGGTFFLSSAYCPGRVKMAANATVAISTATTVVEVMALLRPSACILPRDLALFTPDCWRRLTTPEFPVFSAVSNAVSPVLFMASLFSSVYFSKNDSWCLCNGGGTKSERIKAAKAPSMARIDGGGTAFLIHRTPISPPSQPRSAPLPYSLTDKQELAVGVVIATDNLIKLSTDGVTWSPGSAGFDFHGNLSCDPMKLLATSPNTKSTSTSSSLLRSYEVWHPYARHLILVHHSPRKSTEGENEGTPSSSKPVEQQPGPSSAAVHTVEVKDEKTSSGDWQGATHAPGIPTPEIYESPMLRIGF
ncbi:hypothetical protein SASPL_101803 [Salvia splendens]|uniref:Uncharacterized protein n=1 Tax=Salvia splendens TaxID=180675 RepID=A0A8X8YSI1_SALSN|nr:hypothetical protein SASPL_101803 [Salvia splendens]